MASAVHLGLLPADRLPSREEVLNIPYFNKLSRKDFGRIIYRGTDSEGHKVFSFGRGTSTVLLPCIENLINLLSNECGFKDRIILSNMSPCVPPAMTAGGMLSRWLGIHFIGVPLLVIGARETFPTIVEIVKLTKERAKQSDSPVTVLQNFEDVKRIHREQKQKK